MRCLEDTISERQILILGHLNQVNKASRQELAGVVADISRITLIRDLNNLKSKNLIYVSGRGPTTNYSITKAAGRLRLYDPATYFLQEPELRRVQFERFMIDHIGGLRNIISERQIDKVTKLASDHQLGRGSRVSNQELERFIIDFSWKSSKIEGNTYSLLDTEQLIKFSVRAAGNSHREAIMILNHKAAFDYVWQYNQNYQDLSRAKIEDVHQLLTQNLDISRGIRESPVGIIGTNYRPPTNKAEIISQLDQIIKLINNCDNPFIASLMALVGLSYLQPFADGNKRTARLVSNAILIANDYPPISYRTVNESNLKGALILFYEQNAGGYIFEIFVQQFEFSARNYGL